MLKILKGRKDRRKPAERDENLKNATAELELQISERACTIYVSLVALVIGLLQYPDFSSLPGPFPAILRFGLLIIEVALGICGMQWFHTYYHERYSKLHFLKEHPDADFADQWYHVHIPAPGEVVSGRLRAGTVEIAQNYYELSFHGVNTDHTLEGKDVVEADDRRRTTWYYESVTLSMGTHNSILGTFSAKSSGEKIIKNTQCPVCGSSFDEEHTVGIRPGQRGGIHDLTITMNEDKRPVYLHGNYRDLYPSHSNGTIHIYRNIHDRDAKIKQYLGQPETAGV